MAFIDDLKNAVANYATNNCKTEIVSFEITDGGGTKLQVGETFRFKVKVTNESHLDMKSVRVGALGTSFADVAFSSGSFGSEKITDPFTLDAHQSHTTGFFRGKAKKATEGVAKDIVTARIDSWDAGLDNILKDHSQAGAAEGKLNKTIGLN